ncbi:MAG: TonB-dependent receptor [Pedobacter sp.]|nr:MAG: TonB-dependent receptor [Pedobacter sp.]
MDISAEKRKSGVLYTSTVNKFLNLLLIHQLMRVSGIITILLITTIGVLFANLSRGQDITTERVAIGLTDESLSSGLKKIEQQTSLRFYYRKAEIKEITNLNLPLHNRTIAQTLQEMLKNTFFSFRQINGSILIERSVQTSYEIKGRIVDINHHPIVLANVIIKKAPTDKIIQSTQTDTAGYFRLIAAEKGNYLITISEVSMDSLSIALTLGEIQTVQLPDIILTATIKQLKQVNISSKAPVLERKVDRLIYNLNNTISANGASLFEALQAAPLLTVSDGGVSMMGKGSMAVMVNEKIIYLSGTDLANYLKTLRAENVEKIEIITTPPSKYEAQGSGGLINIVLKKNQSLGWKGSVGSTYYQNARSSYNNSLALFFRSKKVSSSFTFNQSNFRSVITESVDIIGQANQILSNEKRFGSSPNLQTGLSLDYELNKSNNLGLIYNISDNNGNTSFSNTYSFVTGSSVDSVLKTTGEIARPLFTQTLNLYHDLKVDSNGKKLSSSINFFTNRPEMNNDFISVSDKAYAAVSTNSFSEYRIWSAQSDLTLPYKWAKIETGVKFATYNNGASLTYANIIGNAAQLDKTRSNDFDYTESNLAAYYSMESDLSEKWTAKAGVRYEYTIMDGYSPTLDQRNQNKYGAIFPTVYLVYKADADNTVSVNYAKRINRPRLNQLNPFIYYTNIYTSFTGNPVLLPSYSDNFELNYLYKGMLSLTAFTQHTSDEISSLITVNGPLQSFSTGNFLTTDNLGAYASFNKTLSKWWENNTSASFFYSSSKSSILEIPRQDGFSASINFNNSLKVNNDLSFYLNYAQNLPSTSGNVYSYAQRSFRTGARLKLLKDNLIISPSYFLGSVTRVDIHYSDFVQTQKTDYNYNTFNLNLTYLFGRSKVSGNNKNISFDEKRRAQQ